MIPFPAKKLFLFSALILVASALGVLAVREYRRDIILYPNLNSPRSVFLFIMHDCKSHPSTTPCMKYRGAGQYDSPMQDVPALPMLEEMQALTMPDSSGEYAEMLREMGAKEKEDRRENALAAIRSVSLQADEESFQLLSDEYARDQSRVFYFEHDKTFREKIIKAFLVKNADAKSFGLFDNYWTDHGVQLAKDSRHVYIKGGILQEADVETFRRIASGYYRDMDSVFFLSMHGDIEAIDRDANTFQVLSFTFTARDGTLEGYTLDKNGAYIGNVPISGADPKTFAIVGKGKFLPGKDMSDDPPYSYARDAKRAYYRGQPIVNADSATFDVIPNGAYYHEFAKDKNFVYYDEKKIEGADPMTYRPLKNQPYEGCLVWAYGVDKNAVYYETVKIPSADLNTFKAFPSEKPFGGDKDHVYEGVKLRPDLDPKTFEPVCNYG